MSIFTNNLQVSVFGESHGKYMGITIHNFPCNISLNIDKIKADLKRRSLFTIGKSKRTEADDFEIITGFYNGVTTGAPLTFLVANKDVDSKPYLDNIGVARPSHGDYAAFIKYKGVNDFRGGGHLSGRLTALFIILGSICEGELEKQNIKVVSRIKSIYDVQDDSIVEDYNKLDCSFPVYNDDAKKEMVALLATLKGDSVGGVIETFVQGVKVGLGNPIFDSVESVISHLIFSIPGVKGIEFGAGFDITKLKGSDANDQMEFDDGKVTFLTNNSGGIQGGISNGEIINFKTAIKPTPSISNPLKTINFKTNENIETITKGRHDSSIVPKVVHVINALTIFAIYDLLLGENSNG
jgi:chorismate synthase